MTKKLTDEELEQKVKELETEIGRLKKEGKALREGQDRFIKAFMAGPDCI